MCFCQRLFCIRLGKYRPDKAFELRVKWSVATGALITELISTWARKAQANGLSIIPIPGDPFALPSQNSDPIRGPIYVDLNTDCLKVTFVENLYVLCNEAHTISNSGAKK